MTRRQPNLGNTAGDESAITAIQPTLLSIAPRVLLVDDDEMVIEHLRDLITAAGFEVFRQKPIDPLDLAHEVARLAGRRERQPA
jgi:PleD family two-component response regulator